MKTIISISENGKVKRTSAKKVKDQIGEERYNRMKKEAIETWHEDPLTQNSFWLGGNNFLYFAFQ